MSVQIEALIFDMDGTMIDSMPWHAKSWVEFARRHGITMSAEEILRRTTGRTGTECMHEVFQRALGHDECQALVHEKEDIYREMFDASFTEVAGFTAFARVATTVPAGIRSRSRRQAASPGATRSAELCSK